MTIEKIREIVSEFDKLTDMVIDTVNDLYELNINGFKNRGESQTIQTIDKIEFLDGFVLIRYLEAEIDENYPKKFPIEYLGKTKDELEIINNKEKNPKLTDSGSVIIGKNKLQQLLDYYYETRGMLGEYEIYPEILVSLENSDNWVKSNFGRKII